MTSSSRRLNSVLPMASLPTVSPVGMRLWTATATVTGQTIDHRDCDMLLEYFMLGFIEIIFLYTIYPSKGNPPRCKMRFRQNCQVWRRPVQHFINSIKNKYMYICIIYFACYIVGHFLWRESNVKNLRKCFVHSKSTCIVTKSFP